jgi:hypothetical protein
MVMSRHMPPSPGDFLHNALTGEELAPNGREGDGREEVIDLTPLGSTLSLEAGVVGIALTHARKVVALRTYVRFRRHQSRGVGAAGNNLLTVPPEVAEGSTEA